MLLDTSVFPKELSQFFGCWNLRIIFLTFLALPYCQRVFSGFPPELVHLLLVESLGSIQGSISLGCGVQVPLELAWGQELQHPGKPVLCVHSDRLSGRKGAVGRRAPASRCSRSCFCQALPKCWTSGWGRALWRPRLHPASSSRCGALPSLPWSRHPFPLARASRVRTAVSQPFFQVTRDRTALTRVW